MTQEKENRITEKMNNSSLETAVTPVSQTSALTSYADSAPGLEIGEKSPGPGIDGISNPYEPQDMKKVLERSYKVAEFSWLTSKAYGDVIGEVRFPEALFNIENIQDKLAQFEYLRADVEVEVKINATQFHIGAVNISHVSHGNSTDTTPINTAAKRFNLRTSTVMSISSLNSVKQKIARTGPRFWDNIHWEATTEPSRGSIGTLFIDCLNPIGLVGGDTPTNLTVSVFANFLEPKVAGYGVSDVSALMLKRKTRRLLEKKDDFVHKKSATEATHKAESGLISGVVEAASSFAPLLAATPFAEFAPIVAAGGALAPFLKSLGLCKPIDYGKPVKIMTREFEEMTYCHGVSTAVKLSTKPSAGLADTDYSGLTRNKISKIIMTPGKVLSSVIDATTLPGVTFLHFPVAPTVSEWTGTLYYPTPLALMSQMFSKWRGGMKFKLLFVTSAFTTARIRILHLPNPNLPPDIEEFAGDIPNTVVDIRGTTEFEFTVPFLSAFGYLATPGYYGPAQGDVAFSGAVPYQTPWISVSLVNPVNIPTPGGNSKVYFHMWAAGAEDMQLGDFTGYSLRRTGLSLRNKRKGREHIVLETKEKKEIKKKSLEMAFSKPFPSLVPSTGSDEVGFILPEKNGSLEEILKRPNLVGAKATGAYMSYKIQLTDHPADSTQRKILEMFQFYRGAVRLRRVVLPTTRALKIIAGTTPSNVVAYTGGGANCDLELPYDDRSPCIGFYSLPQDEINAYVPLVQMFGPSTENVYFSVGEDFMLGGLLPTTPFDPPGPYEEDSGQESSDSDDDK